MLKGENRQLSLGMAAQHAITSLCSDAVEANLLALPDDAREIYHVSSGIEVSLNELFCGLKQTIGFSVTEHKEVFEIIPMYAEPRLGEIHRIALSPTKIQRDLGWMPQISLQDGLEQTVPYCRSLTAACPKSAGENS